MGPRRGWHPTKRRGRDDDKKIIHFSILLRLPLHITSFLFLLQYPPDEDVEFIFTDSFRCAHFDISPVVLTGCTG